MASRKKNRSEGGDQAHGGNHDQGGSYAENDDGEGGDLQAAGPSNVTCQSADSRGYASLPRLHSLSEPGTSFDRDSPDNGSQNEQIRPSEEDGGDLDKENLDEDELAEVKKEQRASRAVARERLKRNR
eukprot:1769665-Pleurochrysis_carterae.AAC.1